MHEARAPHKNWLRVLQGAVGCAPKVAPLPRRVIPNPSTVKDISKNQVRQWASKKMPTLTTLVPHILNISSENTKIRQNVLLIYMQRHKELVFEVCSFGLYSASELPQIVSAFKLEIDLAKFRCLQAYVSLYCHVSILISGQSETKSKPN